MDESKYHPQQDVFRLIDGKKESVQPYRFGYGSKELAQPEVKPETDSENSKEQKGPYIKDILFNGTHLITKAIDAKGDLVMQKIPAVSGLEPDKPFSYSRLRQHLPNNGPIPEGSYSINPQEIQKPNILQDYWGRFAKEVNSSKVGNIIKISSGKYPGGKPSWGNERTPIQDNPGSTENIPRNNFFIHGGDTPGSGGCIDLTKYEKAFFDFLKQYRGEDQEKIPLTVKYPPELTGEDPKDSNDDKRGADDSDKE